MSDSPSRSHLRGPSIQSRSRPAASSRAGTAWRRPFGWHRLSRNLWPSLWRSTSNRSQLGTHSLPSKPGRRFLIWRRSIAKARQPTSRRRGPLRSHHGCCSRRRSRGQRRVHPRIHQICTGNYCCSFCRCSDSGSGRLPPDSKPRYASCGTVSSPRWRPGSQHRFPG